MDITLKFPIFRLNEGGLNNLLRVMTVVQLFQLSLVSNKCKLLVKALNITATHIVFGFGDQFGFAVCFHPGEYFTCRFVMNPEGGLLIRLERPQQYTVHDWIQEPVESAQIVNPNNMAIKDLVDHVKEVFNIKEASGVFGWNSNRYDLQSIFETVSSLDWIQLEHEDHGYIQEIVNLFKPTQVKIGHLAVQFGMIPKKILMQNYDGVVLDMRQSRIKLDDLMVINSLSLIVRTVYIPERTINKFLKLWIKGSNPRIEHFEIHLPNNTAMSIEAILDGLQHQQMNGRRIFKSSRSNKIMVTGGADIQRFDGVKATLGIEFSEVNALFKLYVWHNHCTATEEE